MSTRIKNWARFQHYKHREPPWIKLHRSLLNDPEWHDLDPAAAKTLVMLWLIASENDGELPAARTLAFRLRIPAQRVASVLQQLDHWLEHDASTTLADCVHDAASETEAETEREAEESRHMPRKRSASAVLASRKAPLPANWQLSESDREYARERGWTDQRIETEYGRFCDHALANGRRQIDWHASWRGWVTSPFNGGVSNGRAGKPDILEIGRELADRAREFEFAPRPGRADDTAGSD